MSVLVTDKGFGPVPAASQTGVGLADLATHNGTLDLVHTDDPVAARAHLAALTLIRVHVPAFSDGRGFTIGARLRMLGYTGALHAVGPIIADQYPMARRVGFDAVEIPDDLAARQPQEQWVFRADWRAHHYQARLRA